tara:strand:- start:2108 stop:2302 length:195 start_codon:yes stop_codon:yes gene_type:complete
MVRLTFDIEDETWDILTKHLKHGSRKYIYRAIIEGFAKKLHEDPKTTLAQVVTKQWNLGEYLKD